MRKASFSCLLVGVVFMLWLSNQVVFCFSSQEIKIIAHQTERVKTRIFARGNVEIHYKNLKLMADVVELDTESKDVVAEGHVVIHFPQEVISAERLEFNLDSKVGELHQVRGLVQPTIFYQAELIKRDLNEVYYLTQAQITSCSQPVPRWLFSCARANFKKNEYIEMWGALFRLKKIPVFYWPYFRYPLGEERKTGFLTPQLGYSGVKGLTFSQSFYWSLRRNMDATFNFDYYSARGFGGGLEYRYLFSPEVGGEIRLFGFHFTAPEELGYPDNAYIIRVKHNQPLPFQFNLVADVDYQSSFDFLREFDNNFKRALISNRTSQVYLSRAWSYYNLSVRASRFETYFRQLDNSVIRYYLPQINFSSTRMNIWGPLYFSFGSSFIRWEYGYQTAFEKGKQKKSQSLNFQPTLSVPFSSIPWLTVNLSGSAKFNYYFNTYAPNSKKVTSEPLFTQNYLGNVEIIGPVFYRLYFRGGEPYLKHIFEPSFSYVYESPISDSERIVTTYYFLRNHYLRYGLTNRFLVKQSGMPREVFTLGIFQNYYLAPEESPLQLYRVEGEIPRFSDINAFLRFYPGRNTSLDFSAGFNPYYHVFSSLRVSASLGLPTDDWFCRLNWYKSSNPFRPESLFNRHQIGFSGGAKIPSLSLEAQSQIDFNLQEKELLYLGALITYHYQCLDFIADLRVFYFREKPEVQFRISFGLGNIGKSTDFLGGINQ